MQRMFDRHSDALIHLGICMLKVLSPTGFLSINKDASSQWQKELGARPLELLGLGHKVEEKGNHHGALGYEWMQELQR